MTFVDVHLTSRVATLGSVDGELYDSLRKFWSFHPPGYIFSPKYKMGMWDGRINLLSRRQLSAGLFRATYRDAELELGIKFKIRFFRADIPAFLSGIPASSDEKYKFQDDCVAAICKAIPYGGGIVLAATGSGKTAMAAKVFSRWPGTALFIVDQVNLLYQTQEELAAWLKEPVGVIGDQQRDWQRVTVATVQTLSLHMERADFVERLESAGLLFVDEFHEQLAHRSFDVLNACSPLAVVALTATLEETRKDIRMKAFKFAGPVLYRFPVAEGMETGVLVSGRVLQLRFPPEEVAFAYNYQDFYAAHVLAHPMKDEALHLMVSYLVQNGRYVLVLCYRVDHVKKLSAMLHDIPHAVAYGKVTKDARTKAKADFEAGDIRLMIANVVMKKGINMKRVDVIIDVAEMRSRNDVLQKFGRGLRQHDDKSELLYIDFATQKGEFKEGRFFARSAGARATALRAAGINVKTQKVENAHDALRAVMKFMESTDAKH